MVPALSAQKQYLFIWTPLPHCLSGLPVFFLPLTGSTHPAIAVCGFFPSVLVWKQCQSKLPLSHCESLGGSSGFQESLSLCPSFSFSTSCAYSHRRLGFPGQSHGGVTYFPWLAVSLAWEGSDAEDDLRGTWPLVSYPSHHIVKRCWAHGEEKKGEVWEAVFLDRGEVVVFSHQVMSDSLLPHGLQHAKLPCPSLSPGVAQVHVHWIGDASQRLILCCPLLLPLIFPTSI